MKPIPGYEGIYTIDEQGNVFSIRNNRCLERWTSSHGYWCVTLYNGGRSTKSNQSIHRLLALVFIGPSEGREVDHKDGNKKNNAISNLRYVTRSQNMINRENMGKNTSGFLGVNLDKKTGKWAASICCNGVRHWLGYHETKEAAGAVYKEVAKKIHAEFIFNPA